MDATTKRILVLGRSGAGKRSLASTICGEELLQENQFSYKSSSERRIILFNATTSTTLIVPPDVFGTNMSEEESRLEIVRCMAECAPGPHAFLIVLKVEKYIVKEQAVVEKIIECFSEEVFRYAIVVFTHGDQLPKGMTIQDVVHQNELLSDLVERCGGRCHVFDNKYWNEETNDEYRSNRFQVEELLGSVERIIMENDGSCYTNEMLQAVEKEKQPEEVPRDGIFESFGKFLMNLAERLLS